MNPYRKIIHEDFTGSHDICDVCLEVFEDEKRDEHPCWFPGPLVDDEILERIDRADRALKRLVMVEVASDVWALLKRRLKRRLGPKVVYLHMEPTAVMTLGAARIVHRPDFPRGRARPHVLRRRLLAQQVPTGEPIADQVERAAVRVLASEDVRPGELVVVGADGTVERATGFKPEDE
jgi:hypothetical protein